MDAGARALVEEAVETSRAMQAWADACEREEMGHVDVVLVRVMRRRSQRLFDAVDAYKARREAQRAEDEPKHG